MVDVASDGRVVRGERNREAIVDALLSLYDDGNVRPGVVEVAERAGVSTRSVHNHFADMEALRAEVAERQWARYEHLTVPPPNDQSLEDRIEVLVERRSVFYEAITPVRRAALLAVHTSPTITRRLGRLSRLLRNQLAELFAGELYNADESVLDAIDLCTSWDAWERLRTQQRLSVRAARRVVATTIHLLLGEGA
jgi:TetR/AcrR family transcriptional regulator, regulator of autoinduction and epiphytic fitness